MDRFLLNNTVLRVIAIVLAVALWVGVHLVNTSSASTNNGIGISQSFPKDIQVETPKNLVVTSVKPARGSIVISANPQTIASLPAEMIGVSLIADARGLSAGTHQIHVAALHMPAINGSSFSVQPALVTVTLVQNVSRFFNVDVQISGNPKNTYTVGQATTDVADVQVSGDKADVSRVAKVIAQVSVSGMSHTVNHVANLVPVDAKGNPVQNVTTSPVNCTVTVPIHAPAQPVKLQAEVIGMPAAGYAVAGLSVNPDTVSVSGEPAAASGNPLSLTLPIDVTGLQATHTTTVNVPLQNGATSATPTSVKVTVQIEKSLSKTFNNIPIQTQSLKSGEQVKFPSVHILRLTVSGPQSIISQLGANNLTAYIDASTLLNSTSSAPIQVLTPEWVQVTQMSLSTVKVQVSGAGQ